ncbi:protein trichome birefringence-like 36 [Mangifera indica]|uniref:protein trichome birefringence-like 36 n=1 Tax=Mangifera indica TaxID=29780 RepID=UPI001CFBC06C|nr:protein trichome birefringence-like 36 [Mangifera indica]
MAEPNANPKRHFHFTIFMFATFLCFFRGKSSQFGLYNSGLQLNEDDNEANMAHTRPQNSRSCDYTAGKWVYDPSYPLYDTTCPYLSRGVNCQKNGRPDSEYQKWKWKPHSCSIPRFDALKFLAKVRRKRVMLVGDSIMRNQWESLVCLVQGVVPTGRKKVTYNGISMAFHALDFDTSIEFCWAPLLVELKKGPENKRILHLDLIEENARYWRGVDILVFDSAHWWTHPVKKSWDFYMEGHSLFRNINNMVAYQKGLTTWAKWVDLNLDPRQTRVIFRSISPQHNRENGWKCYNQKTPLPYISHQYVPETLLVLKEVLRRMRFPVYLQDITTISAFRRDGHPSVYRRVMNQERQQHPTDFSSDCSHWCLPGVPDIWNEMLSAMLKNTLLVE